MALLTFRLVDALDKVLPTREPRACERPVLYALGGQTVSIQLSYYCENRGYDCEDGRFFVCAECPLPVTVRRVCLVPSAYPCHGVTDAGYLTTEPGLLPDLLLPLDAAEPVTAVASQWRSIWFDVSVPETAASGEYPLQVTAAAPDGATLFAAEARVRIAPAALAPQTLYHTEWFHADCLADYYGVPVWSEAHWNSIDRFMAAAAAYGVNLLLTPVLTPPLDTAKGGARTRVQLADIRLCDGAYTFDFSRLGRWIALCRRNGIGNLEIAHLFSQWGAACAPAVYAQTDTGERRIFGWDTPACGGAYTAFLEAYLPALKAYLAQQGMLTHTFFHISDEPEEAELSQYAAARESVRALLADCRVIDALSSFAFYRKGLVEHPVVAEDHLTPFLEARTPSLWTYCCMAQALDVPNRFMSMPSGRGRILGALLYKFDIDGFLHWGFNFYNSKYSLRRIDPYRETDAGEAFPSGDAFLVYPAPDGTAYGSLRGEALRQAMYDWRALKAVETRHGRDAALALLESCTDRALTFTDYPMDAAFFSRLGRALYTALAAEPPAKEE